jgi:hypothetical protein
MRLPDSILKGPANTGADPFEQAQAMLIGGVGRLR